MSGTPERIDCIQDPEVGPWVQPIRDEPLLWAAGFTRVSRNGRRQRVTAFFGEAPSERHRPAWRDGAGLGTACQATPSCKRPCFGGGASSSTH